MAKKDAHTYNKFITTYNDPNITDIYACSDIHGDIEALLIELECCAKVIRRNESFDTIQRYFEDESFYNIMNNEGYKHDLGYSWCGGNKYIVIVGDIMDRCRSSDPKRISTEYLFTESGLIKKACGEYPYEELKILLLLNALNKQALEQNGKIIRLAGNHEIMSLLGIHAPIPYIKEYNSEYVKSLEYYDDKGNGCNKITFFERGNPGSRIMYGDGLGIVVKIHDYIFIHAGILESNIGDISIENLDELNEEFMKYFFKNISALSNNFMGEDGMLATRKYDQNNDKIHTMCLGEKVENIDFAKIAYNKCTWGIRDGGKLCELLNRAFSKLCKKNINPEKCAKSLKMVVGHCPQSFNNDILYGVRKTRTPTYSTIAYSDDEIEILRAPIKYEHINIPNGLIYGITVDCYGNDGMQLPSLYRIDIAVSKGFDSVTLQNSAHSICDEAMGNVKSKKNKLSNACIGRLYYVLDTLLQRLPQMLHINCLNTEGIMNYDVSIVRASFKTLINRMSRKYLSHDRMGDQTDIVKLLLLDFYDQYYNKMHVEEEFIKIMYNYVISDATMEELRKPFVDHMKERDVMHKYMKYKAKYLAMKK